MAIKKRLREKPDVRFLFDMKGVIYDQKWLKKSSNFPLYYMYRGLKEKGELRYDITVIPPKMLGKEFTKTKGNCNSNKLQELYTVLKGKAIFLMQKMIRKAVKDVVAVKAGRGNWVIVPPDYYVISINPSKNILKLGNWVSQKNKNIYKGIEIMKGAAYFYTKNGWEKNRNYELRSKRKAPKLRFKKPLLKSPKSLDFLKG